MLFLQLASRILSCAHAQSFFDAAWRPSRPMRAVRTHVKFGQAFQRVAWVQCISGIAIVVGWSCAHQCGSKLPDLPGWKNGPSMIGWRVCSRDLLLISSCFLFSVGHHGHDVWPSASCGVACATSPCGCYLSPSRPGGIHSTPTLSTQGRGVIPLIVLGPFYVLYALVSPYNWSHRI